MTAPSTESFEARLGRLDPTLFTPIHSSSSADDRRALLLVQAEVRRDGDYVFLEVGSHLGGTLQPHLLDPRCRRIYSIDKRPAVVPDVRGDLDYGAHSAATMLAGLRAVYGPQVDKITAFDADASEVPSASIDPAPQICFIDAEHTDAAVFRDFNSCLQLSAPHGVFLFHDANLILRGILRCREMLRAAGVRHLGLQLPGTVHVILTGDAVERFGPALSRHARNQGWFRARTTLLLPWEKLCASAFRHIWLRLIWTAITWRHRLRNLRRLARR